MTQPTPSDQLRLVMDAARSNPRSPDVWVNLGQALLWQNPPAQDRARECFNRALQLAPGHAAARQGLDALAQPTPSAPPASQPYTPLLFAAPPSTVAPMPVAPLATPVVAPVPPPSAVAPVPMTLPVPPTVAPAAINCSQCGCPIVGGTDFCLMCGTRAPGRNGTENTNKRNRVARDGYCSSAVRSGRHSPRAIGSCSVKV